MANRTITRYPCAIDENTSYGTLGTPGVSEVHVIYEGQWTSDEMDAVEQRIIIPYMPEISRCYLRAVKHSDFPSAGKTFYYGQYYHWRFSMTDLDFEQWLQKLETYHQQYSKVVKA
jgi:hypothetical protein